MPEDFDEQEGSKPHEEHPDENTIDKKSKAVPSKGKSISERFPLVGKSELEKLGIDTSDELVISLDRRIK